jgi:hypothetical protein
LRCQIRVRIAQDVNTCPIGGLCADHARVMRGSAARLPSSGVAARVDSTSVMHGHQENTMDTTKTKSDTIVEIMRHNPSASADFLDGFASETLSDYLQRLEGASRARRAIEELLRAPRATRPASAALLAGAA